MNEIWILNCPKIGVHLTLSWYKEKMQELESLSTTEELVNFLESMD